MKRKIIILLTCLAILVSGCAKNNLQNKYTKSSINKESIKKINEPLYSNLNDKDCISFVKKSIENNLNSKNAETFTKLVQDYNKSIPKDLLSGKFNKNSFDEKNSGEIMDLRYKTKHIYPDTNCRINSFLLLKDDMKFNSNTKVDDYMLFMDEDSIKTSNLFDDDEFNNFKKLFSRVETKNSKDPKVQGEIMSSYLSNFTFPEKAKMISLVLHDNLDGDYLFIGHVGVLLNIDEGYLFLEKISFEEPYQAIKFSDKESCYKYLKEKYNDYTDPEVAHPFIMENNEYIDI
ncbi:MAG: DUF4300 family protein [Peptoniphilus lacydonensis]|jgi:membrane associated lipoprotein|uniref:DUF4300 family protein n=1 Tax=Peptoniphilus TaxID=162289 RepID=UPI002356E544|nr:MULTISPECIES: DUF4300 family protein [Peptoniphilus]MDU1954075.1 DUF4300 family protein [Peptoniphilus lacydonensis]MDU2115314.1 DUF4300 family protein [Peptoniphilus lacydonensis]MDU5275845.1 DUF4300 family protein [Peptoniphilus lacydonensis]MDU7301889.1 DUF4300 family protein [Peptoniphilus lacydonensis]